MNVKQIINDPKTQKKIQAAYLMLDHNAKGELKADGIWGDKSEEATREFQAENGLEPSGEVDLETLETLNTAFANYAPPFDDELEAIAATGADEEESDDDEGAQAKSDDQVDPAEAPTTKVDDVGAAIAAAQQSQVATGEATAATP